MATKLILFDLDDTIIKHSGKGSGVFYNRFTFAVNKVFGTHVDRSMMAPHGKTDTGIMLELAMAGGVKNKTAVSRIRDMHKEEIGYCKRTYKKYTCSTFSGAVRLLKELKKRGYILGLATGNLKEIANMKMQRAGIAGFFELGGFGTVLTRKDLVKTAIKAANSKYGKFNKEDIFYFGDSLLDVRGGLAGGARVIAVANGIYSVKELAKEKPYFALKDLSDTRKILKIIDGK